MNIPPPSVDVDQVAVLALLLFKVADGLFAVTGFFIFFFSDLL